MLKNLTLLILLLGCLCAAAWAQPSPKTAFASSHSKQALADSLFNHFKSKRSFRIYKIVLENDRDNVSVLWHCSLLYSRFGPWQKNKAGKEKYFERAIKLAQHALKLKPRNSMANFALAVALGSRARISSIKRKVAAARTIRKYAIRALKADSTNDGAWNILCRWNYRVAHLNFAERLAAKALFGGLPKGASDKKAVRYGQKAIAIDPQYILYYRDLAQAYEAVGKDKKAVSTCQTALQRLSLLPEDPGLKKQCRELVKHLGR